jgi:hypothetical protein
MGILCPALLSTAERPSKIGVPPVWSYISLTVPRSNLVLARVRLFARAANV